MSKNIQFIHKRFKNGRELVKPKSNNLTDKKNILKYENIRLAIKTTFKIIGAAAAAANLLFELRIPEKKDDKLTNSKKGNVILVDSTAKLNFTSSAMKPGAIKQTKQGVNISAKVTIKIKTKRRKLKTLSANILPVFLFFNFAAV